MAHCTTACSLDREHLYFNFNFWSERSIEDVNTIGTLPPLLERGRDLGELSSRLVELFYMWTCVEATSYYQIVENIYILFINHLKV